MARQHRLQRLYNGRIVWPFPAMQVGDWFRYDVNGDGDQRRAQIYVSGRACDGRLKGRGPGQFRTTACGSYVIVKRISES